MDTPGSYNTEGISQLSRYADSLDPDHFQLDERTVDDLLLFITELSFEFNYFDTTNKVSGNWLDFFLSDGNLMLRIFPHFDFKNYFLKYDRIKQDLINEIDEEKQAVVFKKLVEFIYGFLYFQKRMFDKFQTSIIGKDYNRLKEFTNIVGTDDSYEKARRSFYALSVHTEVKLNIRYAVPKKEFFPNEDDLPDSPYLFNNELSSYLNIINTIPVFDDFFSKFEVVYNRLVRASEYFFEKQKLEKVEFKPHISLILAFLELYQSVREELNQFTQKHLDFYYNRVLGIEPKKAVSDKVSVVIKAVPGIASYELKEGTRMLASVEGQTGKEVFNTIEPIKLNQGEISKLKTIFKSDYTNFLNSEEAVKPVKDYKLYAAENLVTDVVAYSAVKKKPKPWALFGEDQRYLPADAKTMEDATMGLLIASPLLYTEDGKRCYSIRFHLSELHFRSFYEHAEEYEMATGINKKVIIFEMLKKAFVIDITGVEGWIRIPGYTCYCPIEEGAKRFIEIKFELDNGVPTIGILQSAIHGVGVSSGYPAVKLMLNNDSFHNPYAFFYKQELERISIRVEVSEATQMRLQNSTGALSTANPFQLFGPQPAIGSYIDLRNTNIFNRFTVDFKIRIKWFDLPKNKEGFNLYYQGYDAGITNDAFTVGLNTIENSRDNTENEERQLFKLFKMNRNPGMKQYLSNTSVLQDIDFREVNFDNEPLMNLEEESVFEPSGTLRMELLGPEEGFGHKLYPVIFPRILMHNAKRFVRKLVPLNTPYTPQVRSIVVDYVLEHAESISGKDDNGGQQSIEMWHLYPFGYNKIYPGEKKKNLKFIPTIQYKSNLFIGLKNILPAQVITFLFQMEENNFLELEEESLPVEWSYLYNNTWKKIDPSNLLEDNTINFKGTGVIKLLMPEEITMGNTILDPSCYWLRISSEQFIGTRVKAIFTQVVTAERELKNKQDSSRSLNLPPDRIREFASKIPEVAAIYQPFESYHGAAAETKEAFYTWVSEHLRHKQRLITATDISQRVLELFPSVNKVMCYNNNAFNSAEQAGDDIRVVVIPKFKNPTGDEVIDPRVNVYTLYKIRNYLNDNISPFLKLTVVNPEYERLKVFCSVIFGDQYKGRSAGMLVQQLNRDIKGFISPWLYSIKEDINTNSGIYPSEILNFIKKLPYISFVTGFNVVHFYSTYHRDNNRAARVIDSTVVNNKHAGISFIKGKHLKNAKMIFKGSKPGAILITAESHMIKVISKDANNRIINKEMEQSPPPAGIGRLSIGQEFLVMNPYDVSEYKGISIPAVNQEDEEIDFYF